MTVGFQDDGKTLSWSPKKYNKEYATFQLPCGKCISCRLEYARSVSIRCVHEAQMYQNNSFVTLTYTDENLKSQKLVYKDFQDFAKRLRSFTFNEMLNKMFPNLPQKQQRTLWRSLPIERRKEINGQTKIPLLVTGEYGDKEKRPHWHALLFNWRPNDLDYKYSNHRGDQVFSSKILTDLWGQGIAELGSITLESAGYCARYATKKLMHGRDGQHDYEPVSKRSSKLGIGKSWIEKYHTDVFNYGYVVLSDGTQAPIPRYYEKWYKKNHPELWKQYLVTTKIKIQKEAQEKNDSISLEEKRVNARRSGLKGLQITRLQASKKILEQRIYKLFKHLKI